MNAAEAKAAKREQMRAAELQLMAALGQSADPFVKPADYQGGPTVWLWVDGAWHRYFVRLTEVAA